MVPFIQNTEEEVQPQAQKERDPLPWPWVRGDWEEADERVQGFFGGDENVL